MVLIDIKKAADVRVFFQESEKKFGRLYEETGQTNEQLMNLSGMLQIRRTLEAVMEDMQEEWKLLKQMSGCLEGACKTCIRYEEEIADFAEEKVYFATLIAGAAEESLRELGDITVPKRLFELLG